ncbi:MAG: HAMP domain-containing sensor histidine kinase [Acidobacteriota bacterium]
MSLSTLKHIWKTTGFRLTIWYSLFLIASSLVLFALAYFLLSSSLQKIDQEAIQLELNDYAATFQSEGLDTLIEELKADRAEGDEDFFVRLADSQNSTAFLIVPSRYAKEFDLTKLEETVIKDNGQWIYLNAKTGEHELSRDADGIEIVSTHLSNGWQLQVGNNTGKRKAVLERFRSIFVLIILPLILIGLAGGMFLSFRALRPIRNLIDVLNLIINKGETKARAPVNHNGDELDKLSILFNTMLGKVECLIDGMHAALDNVAHDLRSPMTRLRGTAEAALRSNQQNETYREALADCLEESESVLTMLNGLMDLSEAETGVMKLEFKPLDIKLLIEDVSEVYQYVAEEKEITVQATAPEELYVSADANRLRQALANLLDNAIKYTPNGGTIVIEAFAQMQQIVIIVKDTGIGIPPEEHSKIWDRLYRGDKSRSQRGLGLGLSLVRAIINAHQGSVDVMSTVNAGSQFILRLPAKLDHKYQLPATLEQTH